MKKRVRVFLPEEKPEKWEAVMLQVKEQVENYYKAKKAGRLRKITGDDSGLLFNA